MQVRIQHSSDVLIELSCVRSRKGTTHASAQKTLTHLSLEVLCSHSERVDGEGGIACQELKVLCKDSKEASLRFGRGDPVSSVVGEDELVEDLGVLHRGGTGSSTGLFRLLDGGSRGLLLGRACEEVGKLDHGLLCDPF